MSARRFFGALPAGLLMAALLLPGPARALVEDEQAPRGVVFSSVTVRHERQSTAFDRVNRSGPLKNYLISDVDIRSQVDGDISRRLTRFDLLFNYGVSDTWGLSLNIPFIRFEQESTLSTESSDPEVRKVVSRLRSRSVSGLGDLRLTTLKRLVFSDWNAASWGAGLTVPPGEPESPYVDVTTLDVRGTAPSVFTFIHYTRYPAISHSRFDARLQIGRHLKGGGINEDGEKKSAQPGNRLRLNFGWSQEFGPFSYGLELEQFDQRQNTFGGERLHDRVKAQIFRLHLGLGNMHLLESGPVAFPYSAAVQVERLQRGFNIPEGDSVTLVFQTFF